MTTDRDQLAAASRAAHAHADELTRGVLAELPKAWTMLDQVRSKAPISWPEWCLMPMGGVAPLALLRRSRGYPSLVAVSALYAWHYSRSVYLVEPGLMSRLQQEPPDPLQGVDELATLPDWCIYAASPTAANGAGVWMHLEHDAGTKRPELRMVVDVTPAFGLHSLAGLPLYLDRPTVTDALIEWGKKADQDTARLADSVDGYFNLARYLAQPGADIFPLAGGRDRPRRSAVPPTRPQTWLVGYSKTRAAGRSR